MAEPAISASGEYLYQRVLPLFEEDEKFGFFGRRICDGIMAMMQGLDLVILDSEANPGWTSITDPAHAQASWLAWCAQLYGIELPESATTTAAKRKVIEELPPQKRGTVASILRSAEEVQRAESAKPIMLERQDKNGNVKAYWFTLVVKAQTFKAAISIPNCKAEIGKTNVNTGTVNAGGVLVGATVVAASVAAGTTVTEISGTEVILSAAAIATNVEEMTFLNPNVITNFETEIERMKPGGLRFNFVFGKRYKELESNATYAILEAKYATYAAMEGST